MQIIALVICILVCSVPTVGAEETTTPPTVETTSSTAATTQSTTAATRPTSAPTTPSEEDDLRESVAQLQSSRQELQSQALALQEAQKYFSDTLEGLLLQKSNLEEQIAIKQKEIDINDKLKSSLSEQIFLNDQLLMQQEQEMLVHRQSMLTSFQDMRNKLRSMSKDGNRNLLQIVANSEGYTDYLISSKMFERLTAIDELDIQQLEEAIRSLEEKRHLLELEQQRLEAERDPFVEASQSLEKTQRELLSLLGQANQVSKQLSADLAYKRMEFLTLSEQHSFLQRQINELLKDYADPESIAPTQMHWPTPDCKIITSSYKSRYNQFHYGLDIASWGDSTGKTIVAAADGTVIFSGEDNSGFGKYVIIDHGNDILGRRIVTLYGHCNDLYVNKGDIVFGGMSPIAAVGNTGDSDGAHLHFEVRINGSAVDPVGEGYLPLDSSIILMG